MHIAVVNAIRGYGGGEKRALRAVTDFQALGQEVTVFGRPGSAMQERCREHGFAFQEVSLRRYWSPTDVLDLARNLRRRSVDVALCYDQTSIRLGSLAAPFARVKGRAPAVVYYYGLVGSFKNKGWNRLIVAPQVSSVVSNAEAGRQELLGFGCFRKEQLEVIYDGVDPVPIQQADPTGLREELGAGPDDLVVLTAARLVSEKAIPFMVEVLAGLMSETPRLRSWILGEGPEEPRVRKRIGELGLVDRIRVLGFRADAPRFFRAADVLCHPTRREGIPNVVREAMVAGIPVVATAASGTPEIVTHGETGLLSPVNDEAALRGNLKSVLEDPELRTRLGRAGQERALREFTEEQCARRWVELFERLRA